MAKFETIPFDDPRMIYYYKPWERSSTGEGPIIRTNVYNDYVEFKARFTILRWFSEKAPHNGVAGFKIWGKDWEIQELLDLYSPTRDSKIERIKRWNFPLDDYTVTLLNTGEKNPDAVGSYLVHSHFMISQVEE